MMTGRTYVLMAGNIRGQCDWLGIELLFTPPSFLPHHLSYVIFGTFACPHPQNCF